MNAWNFILHFKFEYCYHFFVTQGYAEVEGLLKKEGICVAATEKLAKDSGVATASAYDDIVHNLKKTNARGKCLISTLFDLLLLDLVSATCFLYMSYRLRGLKFM